MGVCVYGYVCVSPSESMCGNVTISRSESMSENVKITRAETMSQIFRHIVISTHKNVQIARTETMCTFSLRFFCILQICKGTHGRTHRQTDRQSLLEDASRIKNVKT